MKLVFFIFISLQPLAAHHDSCPSVLTGTLGKCGKNYSPSQSDPRKKSQFESTKVPPRWITEIVSEALRYFTPYGVENALCTKQGEMFRTAANNLTLWAVQMLDAWSRGPSGVLSGNNYDFGNFDQCVKIKVPELNISGRYFLVRLEFWPAVEIFPHFKDRLPTVFRLPSPQSPVWEAVKETLDMRVKQRNVIYWGLCVPVGCESRDVEASLGAVLAPLLAANRLGYALSLPTQYDYSRINDHPPNGFGYHFFLYLTFVLVLAVVFATVFELLMYDEKERAFTKRPWLLHFSVITNLGKLSKPQTEEFSVISGMKTISMFFIIYGHRMMISLFSPMYNTQDHEMMIGELSDIYFYNGIVIVNTFLVITGFLTYYKALKDIDKNKSFSIAQYMYRRWIRLTPAYVYVMGFVVYITPYLEEGPMGRNVIWNSAPCTKYWWTHVLYVNNYVYAENQCLIPSWYMATDMQLYILCSFMGYALNKSRQFGLILLITTAIICIITPGLVVINANYNGVTLLYLRDFYYYFHQREFIETYLQTHSRASPYLIGMLAAYVYYDLKTRKFKFSKVTLWISTLCLGVVMHYSISLAWIFYIPGREYNTIEHFLYAVLHRVGWALPICWVIIAEATTGFGPFQKTLGLNIFQTLNQLTYCALLVHTPIQLYLVGSLRGPPYYNKLFSWWMGAADSAFAYGAALLLYLFVEAPLAGLKDYNIKSLHW